MNEFIIYSVYPSKDEIGCDAWEYHLELNGEELDSFGDDYHDKGLDKSRGFIRGYAYVKGWKENIDYTIKHGDRVDKKLR